MKKKKKKDEEEEEEKGGGQEKGERRRRSKALFRNGATGADLPGLGKVPEVHLDNFTVAQLVLYGDGIAMVYVRDDYGRSASDPSSTTR